MKKIAVFVGTRPEAIKMAPVIKALENTENLKPVIVSTGQHREMLDQVIHIFDLNVSYKLDVMQDNQTLASLTSRLIEEIDKLYQDIDIDFALVQGDTTTAMISSLVSFYHRIPVGHVEAGLRTNDIYSPYPEEVNRRLISPTAALHFAPTTLSRHNLLNENVAAESIHVTGNTVIDALFMETARQADVYVEKTINRELLDYLPNDWKQKPYVLVTGHRRENFGRGFEQICSALIKLAKMYPDYRIIYPVHLNPRVQEPVYKMLAEYSNIMLIPPQDYSSFHALMTHCELILTDSGGIQEEAPSLGKPVLVMRDTTERPEGLSANTVKLIGTETRDIVKHVSQLLDDEELYREMSESSNPYGDGQAAPRIVNILKDYFA